MFDKLFKIIIIVGTVLGAAAFILYFVHKENYKQSLSKLPNIKKLELTDVVSAVNDNPNYIGFIPIFIKTWKKLFPRVKIHIILIADKIPSKYSEYANYITLFNISHISSAYIAQNIRIFWPALIRNANGVLITDIDMVPMNRSYFNSINMYTSDKFVSYRNPDKTVGKDQIAICYCIATPNIWREIFNINTKQDIINTLTTNYKKLRYENTHNGAGWFNDQIILRYSVDKWNTNDKNFIYLEDNDIGYKRLDRIHTFYKNTSINPDIIKNIQNRPYSDYHMLTPPTPENMLINYKVIDNLTKIISFSLWGSGPCYNWGALENALAAQELFPEWTCRYYIGKGVDKNMLRKLKTLSNVEIIKMKKDKGNKMMWRFTPCFETDGVVIVRDTDSILNPRDKAVVEAWLKSDKDFHIIRDHDGGHLSRIMGGMFGVRNGILHKMNNEFNNDVDSQSAQYGKDQEWLNEKVYPLIRDNCIVHDSKPWFEDEKDIRDPFPNNNYKGYIGEIKCNNFPRIEQKYNFKLKNLSRVH